MKPSPKWLNCPIGASFGGSNSCAVFRSNSQNVNILTPKIESVWVCHSELILFESDISLRGGLEVCIDLIKNEKDTHKKSIFYIMKSLFSHESKSESMAMIDEFETQMPVNKLTDMCFSDSNSPKNLVASEAIAFESNITEKLIKSDFEGAMLDCLNNHFFVEAIIISNCGGEELKKRAEKFILNYKNLTFLSIAKSISTNDFDELVSTAPLIRWREILKVISNHASQDRIKNLLKILSNRLIASNLHSSARFVQIISEDFEGFLKITLAHSNNMEIGEDYIIDNFKNLIFEYKIIRILESFRPGFTNYFENDSVSIQVFEVVTKLKYILSKFGLSDCSLAKFMNKNIHEKYLKNKNPQIDAFFDNHSIIQSNLFHSPSAPAAELHNYNVSTQEQLNFNSSAPIIILHSLPASSPKYNDAPIINPNLSKISPQLVPQGEILIIICLVYCSF